MLNPNAKNIHLLGLFHLSIIRHGAYFACCMGLFKRYRNHWARDNPSSLLGVAIKTYLSDLKRALLGGKVEL